jgi:hypothetical protein
VDPGQLRKLAETTVLTNGKRIPGLKLDHPRQLALMHALVRCTHIAAGNTFTIARLYPLVVEILGVPQADYKLGSLRYDLAKLRVKALVERFRARGVTSSLRRAIASVWFFLNCSSANLRPANRRLAPTLPTRLQASDPEALPVGPPLSASRRPPRTVARSRWTSNRRVTLPRNENRIPVTPHITAKFVGLNGLAWDGWWAQDRDRNL